MKYSSYGQSNLVPLRPSSREFLDESCAVKQLAVDGLAALWDERAARRRFQRDSQYVERRLAVGMVPTELELVEQPFRAKGCGAVKQVQLFAKLPFGRALSQALVDELPRNIDNSREKAVVGPQTGSCQPTPWACRRAP